MASKSSSKQKLSDVLPPLVFGTATFTSQYNLDPYALKTTDLVASALDHGIRAFDTSPYYGPAEILLGQALISPQIAESYPRAEYFLLTKVGRISGDTFDYSAAWVRKSILRSLERLHTTYLDVVYCHDVEFVSAEEVLEAVQELRKLRDEGYIKYVGISGYPVLTLCDLADFIKLKTLEPLDIVMSYGHFTLQNTTLATAGLPRFSAAGVDVVATASMLGMGLVRTNGPPVGAQGDWHPAPPELRAAVKEAAKVCIAKNEKLEDVAIRWSIETWLDLGSDLGSHAAPLLEETTEGKESLPFHEKKLGISVIGVSTIAELDETFKIWREILADKSSVGAKTAGRKQVIEEIAEEYKAALGSWYDYSWQSPSVGFTRSKTVVTSVDDALVLDSSQS
jgi:D-arabinose 1-dehydrogenase